MISLKDQAKIDKKVNKDVQKIKQKLEEEKRKLEKKGNSLKIVDVPVTYNNWFKRPVRKGKKGCKVEVVPEQYLVGPDDLKNGACFQLSWSELYKHKYDISKKVFQKLIDEGFNIKYVKLIKHVNYWNRYTKRRECMYYTQNFFRFYFDSSGCSNNH